MTHYTGWSAELVEQRVERLKAAALAGQQRRMPADDFAVVTAADNAAAFWSSHDRDVAVEAVAVAEGRTCQLCGGRRFIDLAADSDGHSAVTPCKVCLPGHYTGSATYSATVEAVAVAAVERTFAPTTGARTDLPAVTVRPEPKVEQQPARDELLELVVLAAVAELAEPTSSAVTDAVPRRKADVHRSLAAGVAAGHLIKPSRGKPWRITPAGELRILELRT